MSRFLCVGVATLDIVNTVERYPAEDSEVRAVGQHITRGGNAANTAVVLSQLGHDVEWLGSLSDQPDAALITADLQRHGVRCEHATVHHDTVTPTSYVTLSRETGSRSIIHYRRLPEYAAADFEHLSLDGFDWVHFEGRAVEQLAPMMMRARRVCGLPVSLEIEKPRVGIDDLFELADCLMFSRDYVLDRGYRDATVFLRDAVPSGIAASCTWGDSGAFAIESHGVVHHVPAEVPGSVVDTLGAGDVFNAGLLDAIARGSAFPEALHAANRLAGRKCARHGLDGLIVA